MVGDGFPAEVFAEGLARSVDEAGARVFGLRGDVVCGFCGVWWEGVPELDGARVGVIGGFEALDGEVAGLVLGVALGLLRGIGVGTVIGPMNGNTWRRYRFVVESDGSGAFLMEPGNPVEYVRWWEEVGFERLASYSSSVVRLEDSVGVGERLERRLKERGVVFRGMDVGRFEEELRAIHELTLVSFAENFLYAPLDFEGFRADYERVRDRVDGDFVRLAVRHGRLVGFVFAMADLAAAARGEKVRLIVKTLAVDPGAGVAGLGSLLVEQVHAAARAKGFDEAIHALQFETNTSLKITGRHGVGFFGSMGFL